MNQSQQPRLKIAAIGEVLWDVFESGPRFGGAPVNFACSVAALAGSHAEVSMVSAVGDDELGRDALQQMAQRAVVTGHVATVERPTGRVDVVLDGNGVASYRFLADCAWDQLEWKESFASLASGLNVVCFGSLGQRDDTSRATIQRFVAGTAASCLRVFDVNLRAPFYDQETVRQSLQLANVLKLNDEELPLLAQWFGFGGDESELLRALAETFELQCVALTRGENGAMILRGDELSDSRGVEANVVDTVGAGDAYTASLVLGLLANDDLNLINQRACEVAAYVCSQPGATPGLPPALAEKH